MDRSSNSPDVLQSPQPTQHVQNEQDPQGVKKMGRFKKSWLLTKSAWTGFRMDKELAALPVLGSLMYLLIIAAVVGGVIATASSGFLFYTAQTFNANDFSGEITITPWGYAALIVVGLILSIVSTFITAAVIHGALDRFKGNDPTVKSSLRAAWNVIGPLAIFSAFSFTVGYIISTIAERLPIVGGMIVNWLAGAAWGIASFFAIPIIVSGKASNNPVKVTKNSIGLIKKVWGESLIASASIAIIAFISILAYSAVVAALLAAFASLSVPNALMITFVMLAVIGLLIFALVFSVMSAFVKAAIFHYATTGESPATFNRQLMHQAFTPKQARKIFGA